MRKPHKMIPKDPPKAISMTSNNIIKEPIDSYTAKNHIPDLSGNHINSSSL